MNQFIEFSKSIDPQECCALPVPVVAGGNGIAFHVDEDIKGDNTDMIATIVAPNGDVIDPLTTFGFANFNGYMQLFSKPKSGIVARPLRAPSSFSGVSFDKITGVEIGTINKPNIDDILNGGVTIIGGTTITDRFRRTTIHDDALLACVAPFDCFRIRLQGRKYVPEHTETIIVEAPIKTSEISSKAEKDATNPAYTKTATGTAGAVDAEYRTDDGKCDVRVYAVIGNKDITFENRAIQYVNSGFTATLAGTSYNIPSDKGYIDVKNLQLQSLGGGGYLFARSFSFRTTYQNFPVGTTITFVCEIVKPNGTREETIVVPEEETFGDMYYSNLLRLHADDTGLACVEYECETPTFDIPFAPNKPVRMWLPVYIGKPEYKQKDDIYVKSSGERVVMSATIEKEYPCETNFITESWHDQMVIALSCDKVWINGVRLTKSDNYDPDWDNFKRTDCGDKMCRATWKMIANLTKRNSNF